MSISGELIKIKVLKTTQKQQDPSDYYPQTGFHHDIYHGYAKVKYES
jgi:hypothetical protein